jgi:hypothetical protein
MRRNQILAITLCSLTCLGYPNRSANAGWFGSVGRPLTEAEINQALNQAAAITKQTLPQVIDQVTTLTDVRVEGTNFIYMNVLSKYDIEDIKVIENDIMGEILFI